MEFNDVLKKVQEKYSLCGLECRLRPEGPLNPWLEASSYGGFIASDEKLIDVLKKDYDFLKSVGKNYEEVALMANRVSRLFPGNIGDYFINKNYSNGWQSCPWDCKRNEGVYNYPVRSNEVTYVLKEPTENLFKEFETRMAAGENYYKVMAEFSYLIVTNMTAHLIDNHHFFEGNTPFRTDPVKLIEFNNWMNIGKARNSKFHILK